MPSSGDETLLSLEKPPAPSPHLRSRSRRHPRRTKGKNQRCRHEEADSQYYKASTSEGDSMPAQGSPSSAIVVAILTASPHPQKAANTQPRPRRSRTLTARMEEAPCSCLAAEARGRLDVPASTPLAAFAARRDLCEERFHASPLGVMQTAWLGDATCPDAHRKFWHSRERVIGQARVLRLGKRHIQSHIKRDG